MYFAHDLIYIYKPPEQVQNICLPSAHHVVVGTHQLVIKRGQFMDTAQTELLNRALLDSMTPNELPQVGKSRMIMTKLGWSIT
jgi:hypothetical protein